MDIDEKEVFQRQALEIQEPGDNFDPKALPQNGEEYLMHMLYERKRCPAVVTKYPKTIGKFPEQSSSANLVIDSKEIPNSMLPPIKIKPTKEWKTMQANEFLKSRSKITLLRIHLANNNYDITLEPPLITDESAWMQFCKEHSPNLRIMLRLNQGQLEQLLQMLSEWLIKSAEENEIFGSIISTASAASGANSAKNADDNTGKVIAPNLLICNRWLGCWIYAVMACLQTPLIPDIHSTLRDIARTCIALRHALQGDDFEAAVPHNLLIYLIAQIFQQFDFLEYV